MRLSQAGADALPAQVQRWGYDRAAQGIGIVHFGIGAFHRAHQAWYVDRAMEAGDRDWAIAGVSLRSGDVAEQLNPQDGLYSLTEKSGAGQHTRVVGAVQQVFGPAAGRAPVIAALTAPGTHIASFTITEKGYCRLPGGGLDHAAADAPHSFYPILAEGLRRRRDAGLPGLTLLSCDNLPHNGRLLEALFAEYLDRSDPGLRRWCEAECACPSTMVDRIVPATTAADLAAVANMLGVEDKGAVLTEPFSQWVIEDRFAGPRPRLERVGVQLVADVAPYETAKLRMLNGAHSALAYLGLERGHMFVHQAVADPALRPLVERLMRVEAATSFAAAPGQDLHAYADQLFARFNNPELHHRLAQIAMDGSQKIPQRWLATLSARSASAQASTAILAALGAWLRHVRGDNGPVDDPLAARLAAAWRGTDLAGAAGAILGPSGLLASGWSPGPSDLSALQRPA